MLKTSCLVLWDCVSPGRGRAGEQASVPSYTTKGLSQPLSSLSDLRAVCVCALGFVRPRLQSSLALSRLPPHSHSPRSLCAHHTCPYIKSLSSLSLLHICRQRIEYREYRATMYRKRRVIDVRVCRAKGRRRADRGTPPPASPPPPPPVQAGPRAGLRVSRRAEIGGDDGSSSAGACAWPSLRRKAELRP